MTDVTSIELTTTRYDEIKEAMFMQHIEINNLKALVRHYEKTINISLLIRSDIIGCIQ